MSSLWKDRHPRFAETFSTELNPAIDLSTLTVGSRQSLRFACETCSELRTFVAKEMWRYQNLFCTTCAKAHSYVTRSLAIAANRGSVADNPRLLEEWDFEKNEEDPAYVVKGASQLAWWKCKAHGHSWATTVTLRNAGRNCPYCGNKKVLVGFNDLATTNPELAREWHPTKNGTLRPDHVVAGSNKHVWWKCLDCSHVWQAGVNHRSDKRVPTGCPKCAQVNSKLEDIIAHHLASVYPDLATVRRTRPIVIIAGKQGSRYELDFILPELGLAFEVQDFTSHSRTRDDEPSYYSSSKEAKSFKRGPTYHAHKVKLAKDQLGLTVVELWEDNILSGSYKKIIEEAIARQVDTTAYTV